MKKSRKQLFQEVKYALTAKENRIYQTTLVSGAIFTTIGALSYNHNGMSSVFLGAGAALITVSMRGIYMSMVSRENVVEIKDTITQDGEKTRKEIGGKLDTLNGKLDTMGDKLDTMGDKLDTMGDKLDTLNGKLDTMGDKLDTMGNTLGTKLDTLSDKLDALSDTFGTKLDALVTILDERLPKKTSDV